jgi:hypothetical protein
VSRAREVAVTARGASESVVSAEAALLSPGHAAELLERLIYEQVLETIDLDRLAAIEMQLALELGALEAISDAEMVDIAKSMIDRALALIPHDPRRYSKPGRPGEDGMDCELCEAEARPARDHRDTHRPP